MSKAMLVMDMPNSCDECDVICTQYYKAIKDENFENDMKPKCCPLREVPQKPDFRKAKTETVMNWIEGYNACIDEIMKGSEENEIDRCG